MKNIFNENYFKIIGVISLVMVVSFFNSPIVFADYDMGSAPSFDIGSGQTFDIGSAPTFDIGSAPSFDVGASPSFNIGSAPTFNLGTSPTFDIGSAPTFDIGSAPTFDIGSAPTFDIGTAPSFQVAPVAFAPAVSGFALEPIGFAPGFSGFSLPGIGFHPGSSNISLPGIGFNPGASNINLPPVPFGPGTSNVPLSPVGFSPGSSGYGLPQVGFFPGFSGFGPAPVSTAYAAGPAVAFAKVPATGLADDPRVITFIGLIVGLSGLLAYGVLRLIKKYRLSKNPFADNTVLLIDSLVSSLGALLSQVDNNYPEDVILKSNFNDFAALASEENFNQEEMEKSVNDLIHSLADLDMNDDLRNSEKERILGLLAELRLKLGLKKEVIHSDNLGPIMA